MSFYDFLGRGYNKFYAEEQLAKLRIIKEHLKVNKQTKLLDVGCGTGLSAKVFDCNIIGIDPSKKLLKQCPFKAIKANAEDLPFKDNEFDVVIAVTSIHNFDDIEKGLREIKRVGKNNFALTVFKKSSKKDLILNKIKSIFQVQKVLEEQKDLLVLCAG